MLKVAAVFFYRQGKILMGLRSNVAAYSGYWGLPGGRIELNEAPITAAKRESVEEVGLLPLAFNACCKLTNEQKIEHHFYLCQSWQGVASNLEPDKCSQLAWFDVTRLPNKKIAIIDAAMHQLGLSKAAKV